jgi:hypothetical protein
VQELAKEDNHELEAALGFPLFTDGENKLGWLMNLNAVSCNALLPDLPKLHLYVSLESSKIGPCLIRAGLLSSDRVQEEVIVPV